MLHPRRLSAGCVVCFVPAAVQAVAGVVGCAELICAALSCPALLLYFMAADGRYAAATYLKQDDTSSAAAATTATAGITGKQASKPRGTSHKTQQGNGPAVQAGVAGGTVAGGAQHQQQLLLADTVQHWLLVTAAAVLALTAALSKEIGITVIGTMLMYDLVLIAPYSLRQQHSPHHKKHGDSLLALQAKQGVACRRQLLRMLCIAATAVTYVKLRQWVAVEQLVAIYRKVRYRVVCVYVSLCRPCPPEQCNDMSVIPQPACCLLARDSTPFGTPVNSGGEAWGFKILARLALPVGQ